jgi:hypothetical protein
MKADYGLDAPRIVRGFAVAGLLLGVAAVLLGVAGSRRRRALSAWPP